MSLLDQKAAAYDKLIELITLLAEFAPDEQSRTIAQRILNKYQVAESAPVDTEDDACPSETGREE